MIWILHTERETIENSDLLHLMKKAKKFENAIISPAIGT